MRKGLRQQQLVLLLLVFLIGPGTQAGGWDLDQGPEIMTVRGKLVCIGCTLQKSSGSNSQCGLYTVHTVGLQLGDGSLWNFVNNQNGHDLIYAHNLLDGREAEITGFLYATAHMIEVLHARVEGVTEAQIAKAALEEDRMIGEALLTRREGEAPVIKHFQHVLEE